MRIAVAALRLSASMASMSWVAGWRRSPVWAEAKRIDLEAADPAGLAGTGLIEDSLLVSLVADTAGAAVPGMSDSIETIFGKVERVLSSASGRSTHREQTLRTQALSIPIRRRPLLHGSGQWT